MWDTGWVPHHALMKRVLLASEKKGLESAERGDEFRVDRRAKNENGRSFFRVYAGSSSKMGR